MGSELSETKTDELTKNNCNTENAPVKARALIKNNIAWLWEAWDQRDAKLLKYIFAYFLPELNFELGCN